MEKNSKRKVKPLFLGVIVVVVVVVASVIGALFVLDMVNGGVDQYSGMFTMKFETKTSNSWTFSAQSAQGYSTIFRDLNQQDLNKISVDSSIGEGKMVLIISQDEYNQSIDLSSGTMNLSADDLGMDMFNPGQISMKLEFTNAKNISVNISWR